MTSNEVQVVVLEVGKRTEVQHHQKSHKTYLTRVCGETYPLNLKLKEAYWQFPHQISY